MGCLLAAASFLSSCSGGQQDGTETQPLQKQTTEAFEIEDSFGMVAKFQNTDELIVRDGTLELYLNGQTNKIKLRDTQKGTTYQTFPDLSEPNSQVDGVSVSVEFINDTGSTTIYNTQKDAIAYGQYYYKKLEKGVRVTYLFGEKKEQKLVPFVLSKDRMENLILKDLDEFSQTLIRTYYSYLSLADIDSEMDRAVLLEKYPSLKNEDIYVLGKTSADNTAISDFMISAVEDLIKQTRYTYDDLKKDNEEHSVKTDDSKNQNIQLSLDYILEQGDLIVTMPKDSLIYDDTQIKITNLEILPFFGASDVDNGYLMVPDGSGAIIRFNNGKTKFEVYKKAIYGPDYVEPLKEKSPNAEALLYHPVFGISSPAGSVLGIVEKGDAIGYINAAISGKNAPVNRAYSSFRLCSVIPMELAVAGSAANTYQRHPYDDDITVRYRLLGQNDGYVQMADSYRNYLVNEKKLTSGDFSEYVGINFLGGISDIKSILGYPAPTITSLTSYEEVAEILDLLRSKKVEKVNVQYSFWGNNGIENTSAFQADTISQLGGKSGFKKLLQYVQQNHISLYPDVEFMYVKKTKMFDAFRYKKHASRKTTDEMTYKQEFDIATMKPDEEKKIYIVSPNTFGKMFQSFTKQYQKYQHPFLSLSSVGTDLNSDFRQDDTFNREQAKNILTEQLQKLKSSGYQLSFTGANAYTLPYAASVTDVPVSSSNNYLFDETVPFYQIALSGLLPLYSEPLNNSSDYERDVLKCVEYGTFPKFDLMYRKNSDLKETDYNFYGVYYQDWISDITALNQQYRDNLKDIVGQPITNHFQIAQDVYVTEFQNGKKICVNYSGSDVTYQGVIIGKISYGVI